MFRHIPRCFGAPTIHVITRCRTRFHPIAAYSSWRSQVVEVPIGGSGNVRIDISRPPASSEKRSRSVLIHVPAGPALTLGATWPRGSSAASDGSLGRSGVTEMTINYRLSSPSFQSSQPQLENRFPQPIHDVCAAFAYIHSSILPSLFPSSDKNPLDVPNVYVMGSHIGGALATTLALTEPNTISAVAVHNPMADWVSLDEHVLPNIPAKGKRPTADPEFIAGAARSIIDARTQLFPTPSAYFDPFASPALFLRAPGRDTPRTHAETLGLLDGNGEPGNSQDEDIVSGHASVAELRASADSQQATYGPYDDDLPQTLPTPSPCPSEAHQQQQRPVRRRKVLRRWPPTAQPEEVLLPRIEIFTSPPSSPHDGLGWLLHRQAEELGTLLRRACFWGREAGFAEERVGVSSLPLLARPDQKDQEKEKRVDAAAMAMARWLEARIKADGAERTRGGIHHARFVTGPDRPGGPDARRYSSRSRLEWQW